VNFALLAFRDSYIRYNSYDKISFEETKSRRADYDVHKSRIGLSQTSILWIYISVKSFRISLFYKHFSIHNYIHSFASQLWTKLLDLLALKCHKIQYSCIYAPFRIYARKLCQKRVHKIDSELPYFKKLIFMSPNSTRH
jgi:hypothetical protein